LVDSIQRSRSLVRLVGKKAIAQAAGIAMTRPSSVAPPERMIEFMA
jgi:hypothetical protein